MTDSNNQSAPAAKNAPSSELPFDPLRLAGGVIKRWRWIVTGALIAVSLAVGVGLLRTQTRYEASVQLMKREVPASFRAGEVGESFRPRNIGTATLVGAALSENVLSRVSAKATPTVSVGLLRQSLTAKEIRNTDFLELSVSAYNSREATADLANLWGREVVEFSRELQSRESREVRQYLQKQIEATDADLTKINQEIIELSHREGIIDAEKQIDAYLRNLGDLDLRCETARIDIKTAEFKIKALESELAQHTAVGEKLAAVRADLDNALLRYTDQNPQVIELRARVESLEKAAANATQAAPGNSGVTAYAGSAIGSAIYMQLVEIRAEREGLRDRLVQLEALRDDSRSKLESLPAKSAGVARLAQTRRSLETARNLLYSRLREAQLFEDRSPGYYQVFSIASANNVSSRPKWMKVLVYVAVGLFFGTGVGVLSALGFELLDDRLRTAAEARRIFQAPVAATLPAILDATALTQAGSNLWSHWPAPHEAARRPAIAWVPMAGPTEGELWRELLAEATRLMPELLVVDVGTEPVAAFADLPAEAPDAPTHGGMRCWRLDPSRLTLTEARQAASQLQELASHRPVWVRLTGPIREPLTTLARGALAPLVIVPTDAASLSFWADQAQRLRQAGLQPEGLVVIGTAPWWRPL